MPMVPLVQFITPPTVRFGLLSVPAKFNNPWLLIVPRVTFSEPEAWEAVWVPLFPPRTSEAIVGLMFTVTV